MSTQMSYGPHLGGWLVLMLGEVNKQSEWGVNVGERILNGSTGNVWADLQLLASHAGSVGAFLDTLGSRSGAVARSFPDRAELLRELTNSAYNFAPVLAVRNGIAHIDERLEERWQQVANASLNEPPQLLVRAVGSLDDGRDRMLNWDPTRRVVAFRRRPRQAEGYDEVDIAALVATLKELQVQSSRAYLWVLFGMPGMASGTK